MHTCVHIQVKNGRCKTELELAANVACLTVRLVLSFIHHHIQLGVKFVRVFSYSYVYFNACELRVCQTH